MTAIAVNSTHVVMPRVQHMSWDDAMEQTRMCHGHAVVSDECAATIAAAYQSARGYGAVFAALIGHFAIPVEDIIEASRKAYDEIPDADTIYGMDALRVWAHNARWED